MFKTILLLLLAFLMFLEPEPARAETGSSASVNTEMVVSTPFIRRSYKRGRPNYKPYRGNSRHKMKKLGPLRRWKLRRKAQRKRKQLTPSVKVGVPTRSLQKK
ncbi:hypothetical protein K3G63_14835 [Hymenobacter sp. HSC-4F20]|uniref:hypothetical protein n=1 Tax=Hymenobacter sp. HSC-4F20 TaxID=2864135 RepID=UPI001C735D7B|nr:hypothetical protein [Hymenobacter sp. HSC-4F20]MBX0291724.1 hypothetical protein [Hymenobacter sp. HSC-4F20]